MRDEIRQKFITYLNESVSSDADKYCRIIDFGLKQLLQSAGELKDNQEVYDVTELERVDIWRDKMRSEQNWIQMDRQHHGETFKAMLLYRKFIEHLDLELNSSKHFAPSRPTEKHDDRGYPLPGITVSESRQTIIIDSDENPDVTEGAASETHVTRYERSQLARQLCIKAYVSAYRCEVCGFRLSDRYGHRQGKPDFIEVHHIIKHADASRSQGRHEVTETISSDEHAYVSQMSLPNITIRRFNDFGYRSWVGAEHLNEFKGLRRPVSDTQKQAWQTSVLPW